MCQGSLRQWLLLTYRIPSEPTRMRTYAWRHLKSLGALYFQQSLWILPKTEQFERRLSELVIKIEDFGGEASLLTTVSPGAAWEQRVIAGFNQARDEEYVEIIENEERFEDEINRETKKEKFTFAELEEREADWERLERWRERVGERDFFEAAGRIETDSSLARGKRLLEEFTARVYREQGLEDDQQTNGERGKDD
jgi:hypothetical protein